VASARLFIYTQLLFSDTPMRILVLSDLHANATALTAALGAAKDRWDRLVCLGDVVGYGPDPNEVTGTIRELGARTIRGNHDKAATDLMATHDFNPVAKAAVDWTRSHISPENLKWLTELPQGPLETDGIVLVHGAFQDEDEYVFTPAQALEGLLDSTAAVTFFGHTHHQGGFSYENLNSSLEVLNIHPRPSESFAPLRIEAQRRYLLNPGSVGQPRDGDPRAAFAIADLEHHVIEFWRVPYDIAEVQARMRAAQLPEPLVHRLVVGR
jgi:predicted phosphodiesterase